ncbi:MAG TPA: pyridoxamine 5'-phosphate oxidase family protein [Actinomycetota bacterium]|nr:pyridoxamine 5'-phosphate oxidase family protein [Actinomycetota bacterium]
MPKYDLSLTPDQLEEYLRDQRTIRLATVAANGAPHVVPLWFVWVERLVFMNSTRGNVTVRNLESNPVATGVVDDGDTYERLRGVIIGGPVRWRDDSYMDAVNEAWSKKYLDGNPVPFERWKNRVWFHLVPEHVSSWDFRKIPEARARARESRG